MAGKSDLRLLVAVLLGCAHADACAVGGIEYGGDCGGPACLSGFELLTTIKLPIEDVQQADIRVCRNHECRSGPVKVDRGPGKDGAPLPERTVARLKPTSERGPGAATIFVDVWPSRDPEILYLGMTWYWKWQTSPDAQNDVFEVSIEAAGATLFETRRVVEKYSGYQVKSDDSLCESPICGLASSIDCPNLPGREPLTSLGVIKATDAPAICPPANESDADAGM